MENDQIEYCGNCPHYSDCGARKGKNEACKFSKEDN